MPVSSGVMYELTEFEWQELEQAGWDFLKARAAERREDAAHDPPVSYSHANLELAARTGQPAFSWRDIGRCERSGEASQRPGGADPRPKRICAQRRGDMLEPDGGRYLPGGPRTLT